MNRAVSFKGDKGFMYKANLNLSSLFINQSKIFKQIHDMKKYNLNEKSILNNIEDLLKNETK